MTTSSNCDDPPHAPTAEAEVLRLFTHPLEHEVEHNLDVIRFLGGTVQEDLLELWVAEEDEAFAEQVLTLHGIHRDEFLIVFGPGAGGLKRMWPLANFAELGAWLKTQYGARIGIVGGKGEEPLGEELRRHLGNTAINVVNQATLRQTAALLKRCHLYIGNDAGPMHLGAAAGVPVIEICCHPLGGSPSHPNSPARFGPWGVPHRVLRPEKALDPCSEACSQRRAHCILDITVEQVKEAIGAQLSQQSGPVALESVSDHAG